MTSRGARSHEMKRIPGVMKLRARVRHQLADGPDPLPRVLAMPAHGHRHVRAAREVDCAEADAVHHGRNAGDHRRRQRVRAPEALVAVAHRGVDEPDHGAMRKSTSPYCTASPLSLQTSAIVAPGTRNDRAHELHDLEDAHLRVRLDRGADLDVRRLSRRGRAVERPDHRRRHVDEAVGLRRRLDARLHRSLTAAEADGEARRLELELLDARLVDEPEDLPHVLRRQIRAAAHRAGLPPVNVATIAANELSAVATFRFCVHTVSGRAWRRKISSRRRSIAHSMSCARP